MKHWQFRKIQYNDGYSGEYDFNINRFNGQDINKRSCANINDTTRDENYRFNDE